MVNVFTRMSCTIAYGNKRKLHNDKLLNKNSFGINSFFNYSLYINEQIMMRFKCINKAQN